ncbi:hypothetical protein DER45DRAFT_631754 [Fusarium avenaceum]|nr:hypothetical protein DER45DRAFT_631754 [Fusarium avenaceum]
MPKDEGLMTAKGKSGLLQRLGQFSSRHQVYPKPSRVFTIKKERSSQDDATLPTSSDISTHSDDNILEEAVQKLPDVATKVREMSTSLFKNKGDTSDRTASTEQSSEVGSALPPPQPLTRSRLRSIPNTKLYDLGKLYGRLQSTIDDSQAATIRSDTSRPADMDDHSIDSSEAPRTAAEAECPAYYILDPHSGGMAYYMYRDNDEKEGYNVEKVSFKSTSPESGVRTYHLEASAKDLGKMMGDSRETPWRFDSSRIPAVIIEPEGSASHEVEADADEPLYAGEEATQSIARKVSDRLQKIRHLREHLYIINGQGQHVPEARGLYLIGDKDIRDVVSIVLDETLKNNHTNGPERPTSTTESSESRPLPRLDESSRTILVASPMAVDPATTINLPKTSYANINATDMQVHTKTRGTASEATTTVITRRSVAEITWARAYPAGYDLDSRTRGRTVSDYCSPTHGGSRSCSDDRQQSYPKTVKGDFVLRQYATPKSTAEILADIMCNKSFEQQLRVSDGTVITSFPRLFSRDCTTTGWLNSPVDTEGTKEFAPSNLYKHGVDAHSGFDETASSGSPGETPKPSPYNDAHFDANPFNTGFNALPIEGNPFPTLAAERRLSASLDADSRRRQSIQVIGIEEETLDDQNGSRPSLMRKIKQGSHKFFHKHHFRKLSGRAPSITSEEDDSQDDNGLRPKDSNIGQSSQLSPTPDDLGMREAVGGDRLHVPGQKEGTCSEDNQPHECVNDLSSREISPK